MKLIIALLLAIPVYSANRENQADKIAFQAAQVTFVASTAADFYSGTRLDKRFCHESNPMLGQNRAVQAAVMAGSTTAVLLLSRWVHRQPGRINRIVGYSTLIGGTVLHGWAAQHNLRLK
jgi:hypothetical protein